MDRLEQLTVRLTYIMSYQEQEIVSKLSDCLSSHENDAVDDSAEEGRHHAAHRALCSLILLSSRIHQTLSASFPSVNRS